MTQRPKSGPVPLVVMRSVPLRSAFLIIIAFTAALAQSPRRISRIEVEGLQRLTAAEVIATSGLKAGEPFSLALVDAAAQRLVDSGFFKKVGYRTHGKGNDLVIVFQVEELKGNDSPVLFDNFIWFTDEELIAAIQREVPSFNGKATNSGNMTDAIKQALQNLLTARNLGGTVEYMSTETEHLYTVSGVPMKICTLHFPGARSVPEEKLIKTTKEQAELDYSRQSARTFPRYSLYPLYRETGQLRATFGAPVAKPDTNPNCTGGVDLTIPVNEGPVYSWARAEWSGNRLMSPAELDAALGMKPDEVASGLKIDKGLHDVTKAYGRTGYLEAQLDEEPEFDDATHHVTYKIAVKEGRQYRMGTLNFKGFVGNDEATLAEKWKLKAGAVFDQSYPDKFLRDDGREVFARIFAERRYQAKALPNLAIDVKPNRETLTVDVTIELKN
jgi:outer membrane protein assembly factor BamA